MIGRGEKEAGGAGMLIFCGLADASLGGGLGDFRFGCPQYLAFARSGSVTGFALSNVSELFFLMCRHNKKIVPPHLALLIAYVDIIPHIFD